MKRLLLIISIWVLLFQPANTGNSQDKPVALKRIDPNNVSIKQKVDVKADSVLKSIDELTKIIDDKPRKVKWKTKIVVVHDTLRVCCAPTDSAAYQVEEPEIIFVHDTTKVPVHDTIPVRRSSLIRRIFGN